MSDASGDPRTEPHRDFSRHGRMNMDRSHDSFANVDRHMGHAPQHTILQRTQASTPTPIDNLFRRRQKKLARSASLLATSVGPFASQSQDTSRNKQKTTRPCTYQSISEKTHDKCLPTTATPSPTVNTSPQRTGVNLQ